MKLEDSYNDSVLAQPVSLSVSTEVIGENNVPVIDLPQALNSQFDKNVFILEPQAATIQKTTPNSTYAGQLIPSVIDN